MFFAIHIFIVIHSPTVWYLFSLGNLYAASEVARRRREEWTMRQKKGREIGGGFPDLFVYSLIKGANV